MESGRRKKAWKVAPAKQAEKALPPEEAGNWREGK